MVPSTRSVRLTKVGQPALQYLASPDRNSASLSLIVNVLLRLRLTIVWYLTAPRRHSAGLVNGRQYSSGRFSDQTCPRCSRLAHHAIISMSIGRIFLSFGGKLTASPE